jgi:hypothetical protein
MAKAVSKKKPFSGELIRLYETDTNRPSPDARRALAKVFDRTEQYIEFGDAPQSESKVKQAAAEYRVSVGVSEEALEIARAFDQMQPQARAYIREQVFIYTVIDKSFPWLRHGRPMGNTYAEFEHWHQTNIETKRAFDEQRRGVLPSTMKEKVKK